MRKPKVRGPLHPYDVEDAVILYTPPPNHFVSHDTSIEIFDSTTSDTVIEELHALAVEEEAQKKAWRGKHGAGVK